MTEVGDSGGRDTAGEGAREKDRVREEGATYRDGSRCWLDEGREACARRGGRGERGGGAGEVERADWR